MHGRELLKKGLVKKVGNGRDTKVWLDNWLLDSVPGPPNYRQDSVVDLTLTINDLIDERSNSWNIGLISQIIAEEDIDLVLNTNFTLSRPDSVVWGFARNGRYDSKSGYKLLESLTEIRAGVANVLPPLEKQL